MYRVRVAIYRMKSFLYGFENISRAMNCAADAIHLVPTKIRTVG